MMGPANNKQQAARLLLRLGCSSGTYFVIPTYGSTCLTVCL